ncbi:hypothetical protein EXA23_16690 [Vibrio cincinnatiensis]|uniref:Uncharacterized protein n=1 Tax=Vibrio cincinnatiensis DSM 19608 TaxID=1123491 RepID=A0A1T4SET9_VIBCI|nr:hypothetical protein [Vibrio cincinnatiensis]MCG3723997.1 hypothetical protein [Vibrio cincinnatiensis]MCG3727683.1 hypothetical protein [Vibrio cincinnatiensis]MCG3728909.1 hypothetical protein [Vibrio cincinnatiensis]MCG3738179.1 hypothetical protein [Vibrio cincinnatiensis]MCG3748733.1 hypothetical protein [Vibrio cincinnatiensis]
MAGKDRPLEGTKEFDEWVLERARKRAEDLFNTEIPEDLHDVGRGMIAGPEKVEDIMPEKTISEDIAIDKEEKRSKFKIIK